GLLLPGGVCVTPKFRVDMTGHMPHMGHAGRCLPAARRGIERHFGLLLIPEMNAVMVTGMHWLDGEHLLQESVGGKIAGDRGTMRPILPQLQSQERLGFDVIRKCMENSLEPFDVRLVALLLLVFSRVGLVERIK